MSYLSRILVVYPKYQEPLLAFCVAMLAGIGLSLLAGARTNVVYFRASALVVLLVMLALAGSFLPSVLAHKDTAFVYYLNLVAGDYRPWCGLIVGSPSLAHQ